MKTSLVLVFASLSIPGCGGGGGGDDTQNVPDASHPPTVDARPGTPDAPVDLTCDPVVPSDCSGETICVVDSCEAAFDRIYDFSGLEVAVATQNQGGSAWDPLGGAPDPVVEVRLNGETLITTGSATDVFSATYAETTNATILAGSTLELHVFDADVGGDDDILSCSFDPLTAADLREAVLTCTGTGAEAGSSVTLWITVRG